MLRRIFFSALLAALVDTGCESTPGDAGEALVASDPPEVALVVPVPEPADPAAFSAERAWEHLERLSRISARETGAPDASRARRYLVEQLEADQVPVDELVVGNAVHLIALLPGESRDRFLLGASYDRSASGPALVLELARALSQRPRPYTLMFILIDEEAPAGFPGSHALAARISQGEEGFSSTRLAVFFQNVGDNDLTITRDLRSHHIYREFFWEAAAIVGHRKQFPPDASVASVDGGHLEFIEQGLPRTVMIADTRFEGAEEDSPDCCSPESLGIVGEVTLEALDRIAARLARIDRFRRSPLSDPMRPRSRQTSAGQPPVAPTAPGAQVAPIADADPAH